MIAAQYNATLFKTYSELETKIPHLLIVKSPTPVEQMRTLGERLGVKSLWVKRDDLTAYPYGGNKPRKLEFIIADAKAKKADAILTFGGIGTNHGLATTIYAGENNLRSLLVLYPQPVTEHVRKNLLLMRRFGAEMRIAKSHLWAAWKAIQWIGEERINGRKVYLLPPGGSSLTGTLGYINAALELAGQIKDGILPCPDYVFVPAGTCGTAAGLLAGFHLGGLHTRVVAVRVVMKFAANRLVIERLCRNAIRFLENKGVKVPREKVSFNNLILLHGYYGAEYGRSTREGLAAIDLIESTEGVHLEPTYTGKTAAGMIDFIRKKGKPDATYLLWNTFNSRDMTEYLKGVSSEILPKAFHKYFTRSHN